MHKHTYTHTTHRLDHINLWPTHTYSLNNWRVSNVKLKIMWKTHHYWVHVFCVYMWWTHNTCVNVSFHWRLHTGRLFLSPVGGWQLHNVSEVVWKWNWEGVHVCACQFRTLHPMVLMRTHMLNSFFIKTNRPHGQVHITTACECLCVSVWVLSDQALLIKDSNFLTHIPWLLKQRGLRLTSDQIALTKYC